MTFHCFAHTRLVVVPLAVAENPGLAIFYICAHWASCNDFGTRAFGRGTRPKKIICALRVFPVNEALATECANTKNGDCTQCCAPGSEQPGSMMRMLATSLADGATSSACHTHHYCACACVVSTPCLRTPCFPGPGLTPQEVRKERS